jgi:hypothetical protein
MPIIFIALFLSQKVFAVMRVKALFIHRLAPCFGNVWIFRNREEEKRIVQAGECGTERLGSERKTRRRMRMECENPQESTGNTRSGNILG